MEYHKRLAISVAVVGAFALAGGNAVAAPVYGPNLIVNGNADADPGTDNTVVGERITGWTNNPSINDNGTLNLSGSVNTYSYSTPNGSLNGSTPGPSDRGANYFSGGPTNSSSSITQIISLSSALDTAIDNGTVSALLSGYLGGYFDQDDNVILSATFLTSGSGPLGSFFIGPVLTSDRNSQSGLVYRQDAFTIPAFSRSVSVTLTSRRTAGEFDDGYADDLSLALSVPEVITPPPPPPAPPPAPPVNGVPEPDVAALLALGATGLAVARRRRSQSN